MKNKTNRVQVKMIATTGSDVIGVKKLAFFSFFTLSIFPVPFSTVLVPQIIPNWVQKAWLA